MTDPTPAENKIPADETPRSNVIKAADFDPPLTGKQVEQVQEVINEALRRRLGEQKPPELPPLKAYKNGQLVTVVKNGDWLDGHIQSIDKASYHLHVHTERGPVTIASNKLVRPRP